MPALRIASLRAKVRAIERPLLPRKPRDGRWTLLEGGQASSRPTLPDLDTARVHEIKPAGDGPAAGNRAAALVFALRLARRRLMLLAAHGPCRNASILWCATEGSRREAGHIYGPGLAALGLDARAFLIVETARESEALWAIEEGLRSASLALVIGTLDHVGLTPARRLALAAEAALTPCLLVTGAHTPAAGATATRWRVGPAASARHDFDPRAPGAMRVTLALERAAARHGMTDAAPFVLEWSDETHCFRMAAALAHRALEAPEARRRAG